MSAPRTMAYEPGLDGLRGVSILAVMAFHACTTSSLSGWFPGGGLGVSVFFTLSGFLITTILTTELDRAGRVDLSRFWTRRIRRLAPASLTVIVAVVVLSRTSWFDARPTDAIAATWSATNWHVIAGGQQRLVQTIVGPLGPTWSLAVEEQFYVLLALAVVLAGRTRSPRRALAVGFVLTVVVSMATATWVSDWQPRLEFGTDVRAGELAAGGLLALAVHRWRQVLTTRTALLDTIGWIALGGVLALFLTADYSPPWLLRGGFVVVAVASAGVVAGVLAHHRLARVLSAGPLVAVGRWSYSLYLVHWPVILVLNPDRTGLDGLALLLVRFGVAFAVAIALHLGVEQPVRRHEGWSARATVAAWVAASLAVTALAATTLS